MARAGRRAPKPRRASPEGGLAALGRALAETLDPAIVARRTVESVRVLLGTRNARRDATARATGTILLVEDETDVRALAREVLEAAGYTILEAESPEAALDVCERHAGPIDLLLTDVVMPRMNGYDLAARVARRRPETRRLYMSGYSEEALRSHGDLAPGATLLQKPFTPDHLARAVHEVLHEAMRA